MHQEQELLPNYLLASPMTLLVESWQGVLEIIVMKAADYGAAACQSSSAAGANKNHLKILKI